MRKDLDRIRKTFQTGLNRDHRLTASRASTKNKRNKADRSPENDAFSDYKKGFQSYKGCPMLSSKALNEKIRLIMSILLYKMC